MHTLWHIYTHSTKRIKFYYITRVHLGSFPKIILKYFYNLILSFLKIRETIFGQLYFHFPTTAVAWWAKKGAVYDCNSVAENLKQLSFFLSSSLSSRVLFNSRKITIHGRLLIGLMGKSNLDLVEVLRARVIGLFPDFINIIH